MLILILSFVYVCICVCLHFKDFSIIYMHTYMFTTTYLYVWSELISWNDLTNAVIFFAIKNHVALIKSSGSGPALKPYTFFNSIYLNSCVSARHSFSQLFLQRRQVVKQLLVSVAVAWLIDYSILRRALN